MGAPAAAPGALLALPGLALLVAAPHWASTHLANGPRAVLLVATACIFLGLPAALADAADPIARQTLCCILSCSAFKASIGLLGEGRRPCVSKGGPGPSKNPG